MKYFTIEILFLAVLLILSLAALNPFWMPMGMQLAVLSAAIVLFGAFAVFVLRENGGDEREISIVYKSDRLAFLAGAGVLLIALVYESVVQHTESPWVLGALAAMIAIKIIAYMYHHNR